MANRTFLGYVASASVFTFASVYALAGDGPPEARGSAGRAKSPPLIYYRNCDAARAAGATPIHRGEPGYADHLDRDGDGKACEPYKGR